MDVFDQYMLGANQYHIRREEVVVTAADLLNPRVPGKITDQGVKDNASAYVVHLYQVVKSCSLFT